MTRSIVPLLTAEEEKTLRLRQLATVFSKADTTLAGSRVVCQLSGEHGAFSTGQAPAASMAGRIVFNVDKMPNPSTVEGLVKINGLNYHELAHILFTPQGGPLVDRVNNDGLFAAFNVMEDQRIETLLVGKYQSVRAYLIATVAEYFLDVPKNQHQHAWPYLYGRKYLPAKMREYFRDLAMRDQINHHSIHMIEKVVDQYRMLDVHNPSNHERAYNLVKRFGELTGNQQKFTPFSHQGATVAVVGGGAGVTANQQSQDSQKAAKDAKSLEEAGQAAPGETAKGKGGKGESSSTEKSEGENGAGGSGAGNNSGVKTAPGADVLRTAIEDAKSDSKVQSDIRNQRDALRPDGKYTGRLGDSPFRELPVEASSLGISRKFGKELGRLVIESDPGFETHRPSGRLNVKRALSGGDFDTLFDEWSPGKQDADSLEVVIMVDSSGSMSGIMARALDAMWTIKSGAESLGRNVRVSVMEFDTHSRYLYRPGQVAKKTVYRATSANGGTNPTEGVFESLRIFANSTRKRKIFFIISDGSWHDDKPHEYIRRMNANGIHTCGVLISPYTSEITPEVESWGRHDCKQFVLVNDTNQLGQVGRELVRSVIKGK